MASDTERLNLERLEGAQDFLLFFCWIILRARGNKVALISHTCFIPPTKFTVHFENQTERNGATSKREHNLKSLACEERERDSNLL